MCVYFKGLVEMASTNRITVEGVESGIGKLHGGLRKTNYKTLIVLSVSLLSTSAFSQERPQGLSGLFSAIKQLQSAVEGDQQVPTSNMLGKAPGVSNANAAATIETMEFQKPIRECIKKTSYGQGFMGLKGNVVSLSDARYKVCDELWNREVSFAINSQLIYPEVQYPENCVASNNNWGTRIIENSLPMAAQYEEEQKIKTSPNNPRERYGAYSVRRNEYSVVQQQLQKTFREKCMNSLSEQDFDAIHPSERLQEAARRQTEEVVASKEAAVRQAKAEEERKHAEAKQLERKKVLMAGFSGPMLCSVHGLTKPTLYLDLGVNNEFKLVMGGFTPVTGKWGSGSFQGRDALLLVTPASSKNSYPDLYTSYEDSIEIAQSSVTLTLDRRSTFPGARTGESYETICVKARSLTLEQAKQLTGSNLKNNPLRPEALAQRQQQEANRPSAAYCTQMEDTYADRPVLQKNLLAKMGCY
jgi:hypothetical protein